MRRFEEGFWAGFIISELLGYTNQNQRANTGQVFSFLGSLILFGTVFFVAGGLATVYPVLVWVALVVLILLYFGFRERLGLIRSALFILFPGTFIVIASFLSGPFCPERLIEMFDMRTEISYYYMAVLGVAIEILYQALIRGIKRKKKINNEGRY